MAEAAAQEKHKSYKAHDAYIQTFIETQYNDGNRRTINLEITKYVCITIIVEVYLFWGRRRSCDRRGLHLGNL